jgi:hypothetical protein
MEAMADKYNGIMRRANEMAENQKEKEKRGCHIQ